MEPTPEAIANDVITLLQQGLAQQEDAEAAIAVYGYRRLNPESHRL